MVLGVSPMRGQMTTMAQRAIEATVAAGLEIAPNSDPFG